MRRTFNLREGPSHACQKPVFVVGVVSERILGPFFSRVPLIKALDLEWNCEKVLNIIRLVLGQKTFNGPVNGARLVCKTVFVLFTFNKDLLMHYSAKEIVKFTPF